MAMKYDYPTAFSCWGDEEHEAIARVIASDKFTMGPEVAAFERDFALSHGKLYGIMVNSGSSANLVAVSALFNLNAGRRPLKRGDVAIVPALAWSTTYAPLIQHGMQMVLSDCDDTWNAANVLNIENEVRLVVGCSILGNPAHLADWKEFAGVQGAYFIEDNCESLGARADGRQLCGTFGLMSTFSFFHSHQVSAIEGGMILTDDSECATLCRMLRAHGWTRDVQTLPTIFDEEYDFQVFGYNVRPLEMHAAIAREQLKKLPGFIKARQANAEYFWDLALKSLPGPASDCRSPITFPTINGVEASPFGLHFTVASREARARLAAALREAGIDCRLPTGGSFRKHAYGAPWRDQQTPNADHIHETGMFLGNAPFDISDKIERAVAIMKDVL